MSDLLKSVIQDLINDRTEQAQVSIHDYIVGKTQQIAGLAEAKEAKNPVVALWGKIEAKYGNAKSIDFLEKTKEVEWVSDGEYWGDPGDAPNIAKAIVAGLKKLGYTGWTVKVKSRAAPNYDEDDNDLSDEEVWKVNGSVMKS